MDASQDKDICLLNVENGGKRDDREHDFPGSIARSKQASNQAVRIDEGCRFMFPLAFLSFNGVYWWYY